MLPARASWLPAVERALAEDLGSGDVTTRAVLAGGSRDRGRDRGARDASWCAARSRRAPCSRCLGRRARSARCAATASARTPGAVLCGLAGSAHAILAGERTALNLLARLSAVATHTRRFVDAVAGTGVAIVDTRKTLPGWRTLEKYAVAVGGGIEPSHRPLRRAPREGQPRRRRGGRDGGGEGGPCRRAAPTSGSRSRSSRRRQAEEALAAGADSLLLDNRSLAELAALAARFRERCVLEASGGRRPRERARRRRDRRAPHLDRRPHPLGAPRRRRPRGGGLARSAPVSDGAARVLEALRERRRAAVLRAEPSPRASGSPARRSGSTSSCCAGAATRSRARRAAATGSAPSPTGSTPRRSRPASRRAGSRARSSGSRRPTRPTGSPASAPARARATATPSSPRGRPRGAAGSAARSSRRPT